jgi:hypothetical protein
VLAAQAGPARSAAEKMYFLQSAVAGTVAVVDLPLQDSENSERFQHFEPG